MGLGSLDSKDKNFTAVDRERPDRTSFNRGIALRWNSKFQLVAPTGPLLTCVTDGGVRSRDPSIEAVKESSSRHASCAQAADSFCRDPERYAAIWDAFHRSRDSALRCTDFSKASTFGTQTRTDRTARVRQGPNTLRTTFLIDWGRFHESQKSCFLQPKSRFSRFVASRRRVALSHD